MTQQHLFIGCQENKLHCILLREGLPEPRSSIGHAVCLMTSLHVPLSNGKLVELDLYFFLLTAANACYLTVPLELGVIASLPPL